jgi:hypothetical protein
MRISDRFPVIHAPGSERRAIQLTSGPAYCYPLYYFIPSITADGRYLVHHRSDGETVQLHRVEITTGETAQLTHASCADTQWHPWDMPAGKGVLDHRSALNVATSEAIYFDGNEVRSVGVDTCEERTLFELPADRVAIGQNCCSPDGRFLFFIHHDRELHREIYGEPGGERRGGYSYPRHLSRGTKLAALDLERGELRTVVALNSPVHHVQPYGEHMLVFSSLAVERAILVTDYDGGWYTHLRTQGEDGGTTCHYCVTDRGIFYEAHSDRGLVAGVLNPDTRRAVESVLPASIRGGAPHVAADPSGRRLLLECHDEEHGHTVVFVKRLGTDGDVELDYLFGDWPTYGSGQKSHFHPRVTDDGEHLIITAGDQSTGTNHVFALDIADLPETRFALD